MKLKTWIKILALPCFLLLFTRKVEAAEFDATYYALRYPDVAAQCAYSPELLYQHYLTYGVLEGRFQNAEEEAVAIEAYNNAVLQQQLMEQAQQQALLEQQQAALAQQQALLASGLVQPLPGYTTYVDVNIPAQTLTYFVNGLPVLYTPCVTGSVAGGNNTPVGVFKIDAHIPGKYLIGPTWKTWVNYWMRLGGTNQVGIHDAGWRTAFGGDIYLVHGSHGCINIPPDQAAMLFSLVNVGTTVVVH